MDSIKLLNSLLYLPAIWTIVFVLIYRAIFKTKGKQSNKVLFIYAISLFVITEILTFKFIFFPIETSPGVEYNFFDFLERATGPYWFAFIIQNLLPILAIIPLMFKKLRLKTRWILLLVISLCLGVGFEKFVVLITSIHRDFITTSFPRSNGSPFLILYLISMLGKMILGLIYATIIFFIFERKRNSFKHDEVLDSDGN